MMPMAARFCLALLALTALTDIALAQTSVCRIGRPSYCDKYGSMVCPTRNKLGDQSCVGWRKGCFECHARIDDCTGPTPIKQGARCETCHTRWLACMSANDAKFWPNRGDLGKD